MMKILLFGDICPTRDTQRAFDKGDRTAVFGDTLAEIENADIVIGNLECAVSDIPSPIRKAGPVLVTNSKSIETLKDFDALSLANNHIRDCGDEGVITALRTCERLGIRAFGAGSNSDTAKQPIIIEKGGLKIGLMSFAEHEFNIATDKRPGAHCFDVYEDFDRIRNFRNTVDYLIILYHGGIEYFPYPSPELKRKCRKMAECGADLISCQHSHCIGTIERYEDSSIIYGQGNSVFGFRKGDENWNRGLVLEVEIDKSSAKVIHKGVVATPEGLKWMPEHQSKVLEQELEQRSTASEEQITEAWDKFCTNLGNIHIPLLLGWSRLLIAINRRTNNSLTKLFYGQNARNITHNLIRCDAHREVITNILSKTDYQ